MYYYLLSAYREKLKTTRKEYDIYNDNSFFASVYREVFREALTWQQDAVNLLEIENWRFDRLVREDGTLRKPKAFLCVERTLKDNFVLDWYPSIPVINITETDWRYWDNHWSGYGGYPYNRILMIREFGYYLHKNSFDKAETNLLKAVKKLLNNVYLFLNRTIDITVVEDFYLIYNENGVDKELIGCRIRKVKDVEFEKQEKKREEWLIENFNKIGLSPEEFLQTFKQADLKYANTSKLLSSRFDISSYRVKKLINRLFDEYPELYDKIIKTPPHGKKSRVSKVVKVDFKGS